MLLFLSLVIRFQGGPDGAVVSEFSTKSRDDLDIFTDPEISRMPVYTD
jgi:D-lyxose ketol-isomerase